SQTFTMNTRYRIIRKVGSGAYGTVCSAFDFQNKRHCAIKKISRVFDKRLIAKRCLREIKLLQHFNGHPHIIDLLDMDIVDTAHFNDIYLVFNCMDASLHDVIHSEQPLDPIHAQWFLYQMLSGLKFIHDAEVIHRDMKPANILVNRDCDLKICDFGMARSYRETDETDTMTEYVTTRWYRAPEVMISHQNYSKLIDIWSVGCIFGEILGRKVLFKGRSYVDQLHTILAMLGLPRDISFWDPSDTIETHLRGLCTVDGQPPPEHAVDFSTLFPQCPPEGIDLLETMLDLDPSHRITADEALDHPYLGIFAQSAVPTPMPKICDFSFEQGYDEQDLRRMIANEVIFFRLRAKAQETMGNM
ncbi:kinase-like domain-containing protein, partial [Radiomyces spectabilis]|uniref:kinase-like domain-containing protein n=1 Tax=Radiomyces spectabilis TaxID=64574 RepID=UPI00221F171A